MEWVLKTVILMSNFLHKSCFVRFWASFNSHIILCGNIILCRCFCFCYADVCFSLPQWRNGVVVESAIPRASRKSMYVAVITLFGKKKQWMRIRQNSSASDVWQKLKTRKIYWSLPHCGYSIKTIVVITISTCSYSVHRLRLMHIWTQCDRDYTTPLC